MADYLLNFRGCRDQNLFNQVLNEFTNGKLFSVCKQSKSLNVTKSRLKIQDDRLMTVSLRDQSKQFESSGKILL